MATPEPDQNDHERRPTTHEQRFTRWTTLVLMGIWVWWWWTGAWGGAFWIIGATVVLAIGEFESWILRPLRPITLPVYMVLSPVLRPLESLASYLWGLLPATYRGGLAERKPIGPEDVFTPEQIEDMQRKARARGMNFKTDRQKKDETEDDAR